MSGTILSLKIIEFPANILWLIAVSFSETVTPNLLKVRNGNSVPLDRV